MSIKSAISKSEPAKTAARTNAEIGRDYCNKLFAIEAELSELPPQERQMKRLELEKPVLEAF